MGMYILGKCYDRGRGVPVDEKRALKWYRKAADKGDVASSNLCGQFFSMGGAGARRTTRWRDVLRDAREGEG